MRVVRLGEEPSEIGASVRAAISAWGAGDAVLGGVALCGVRPPGGPRELDAVLVLPRGIVLVLGADLPQAVMQLDAPLRAPWTADGWPLPRSEDGVNPVQDALDSAAALARQLPSRDAEPLPVSAIVAVGPYVGRIIQPTGGDLDRGVRVLHPSTTSVLAAVRELATREDSCEVEPARRLLESIDPRAGRLGVAKLTTEGFPDAVAPEVAAASTMTIPKVADAPDPGAGPAPAQPARGALGRVRSVPARAGMVAVTVLLVLIVVVLALLFTGGSEQAEGGAGQEIDGTGFARVAAAQDSDCTERSSGDVRAWFDREPCAGLARQVFTTGTGGRRAAVAVAVVELPAESSANELRELLSTPQRSSSGGLRDLAVDGVRWDGAAQAVQQEGPRVRISRAVWAGAGSAPRDVGLRVLAERGLQLDVRVPR